MKYYMAPLEGITGHIYRTTYAKYFGGIDKYFSPFISPNQKKICRTREKKDILPENNAGLYLVPQIMTNQAEMFLQTVEYLQQFGYNEVNLNLGCPAATVVSRKKGSGFLTEPKKLESFLKEIYEGTNVKISIKTRIGYESAEEFPILLSIFNQFPISELIVHPRVQKDRYTGSPRKEFYGETLERAPFPVAYNGDIFDLEDMDALVEAYPGTRHVMLGRGLLANPALARMVNGGPAATAAELQRFHDTLFAAYAEEIGGNAVFRMKEWWFYAKCAFADPTTVHKLVRKTKKVDEYRAAVERVFREQPLAPIARFHG